MSPFSGEIQYPRATVGLTAKSATVERRGIDVDAAGFLRTRPARRPTCRDRRQPFTDSPGSRACRQPAAPRRRPPVATQASRADESYWREIQQAFTLDRTIINLNNGGCCPSPRVVHEALKRYLDISNQAPVYHMWQILEPNIESVRRRLAAEFGCDPEELAITRNASEALQIAQLGIDAQARRRSRDDEPGLRADARHLGAARAPRRDQADEDLVSRCRRSRPAISPIGCSARSRRRRRCCTSATSPTSPDRSFRSSRSATRRAGAASRRSSTARTRLPTFRTRRAISAATSTARACTSGCSRRSARASSTCAARTSRRCGR